MALTISGRQGRHREVGSDAWRATPALRAGDMARKPEANLRLEEHEPDGRPCARTSGQHTTKSRPSRGKAVNSASAQGRSWFLSGGTCCSIRKEPIVPQWQSQGHLPGGIRGAVVTGVGIAVNGTRWQAGLHQSVAVRQPDAQGSTKPGQGRSRPSTGIFHSNP